MAEQGTSLADGGARDAEEGAGFVLRRVMLVTGLASVPTALADLDLVRGPARAVALALALAIILAGVGSLYRPSLVLRVRLSVSRSPLAAAQDETPPAASPAAPAVANAVARAGSTRPETAVTPAREVPPPTSAEGERGAWRGAESSGRRPRRRWT